MVCPKYKITFKIGIYSSAYEYICHLSRCDLVRMVCVSLTLAYITFVGGITCYEGWLLRKHLFDIKMSQLNVAHLSFS